MSPPSWYHSYDDHPATANLIQPSSCCCLQPALLMLLSSHWPKLHCCKQNGEQQIYNRTYSFSVMLEKGKKYMVRDKNKHFRKSKNMMPPSWCCLSDATILTPQSRCRHPDATILTQLYWCHPPNATLLIQPFSCCYPQTSILMLLSSHCHWNFIVGYKMISKNNIKQTYSFSDKLEKRKTYMVRDKNKHFRKSKNLMPPSWCRLSAAAILMPPS